jgi:hypothetical protein
VINNNLRFHASFNFQCNGIDIQFGRQIGNRLQLATNIVFTSVEESEFHQPPLRLNRDESRQLMDSLWAAGVRPSEMVDSVGERQALKDHVSSLSGFANRVLGLLEAGRV